MRDGRKGLRRKDSPDEKNLSERLDRDIGRCTQSGGKLYGRSSIRRHDKRECGYCTYFNPSIKMNYPFLCSHLDLNGPTEVQVESGCFRGYDFFPLCDLYD